MTRVSQEQFYRIEHARSSWRVGQELEFGDLQNEFSTNWSAEDTWIKNPHNSEGLSVNSQLGEIYNSIIKEENKHRTLGELRALPYVLQQTLKSLDDALIANRELVFELVRRDLFSTRPSRMTCLYLIPDDPNCIAFWWRKLTTQGESARKLFLVNASGETHRVSQKSLVPLQTCSTNEWQRRAKEYWQDAFDDSTDDELLFEGMIKVVREVPPSEFELVSR
jgi:hypothetical protein